MSGPSYSPLHPKDRSSSKKFGKLVAMVSAPLMFIEYPVSHAPNAICEQSQW